MSPGRPAARQAGAAVASPEAAPEAAPDLVAGRAGSGLADLAPAGLPLHLEYRAVAGPPGRPLMVFLHEGLGSVSSWRDFPDRLCGALEMRGLVYARPGYGRSTPRPRDERWPPDFMHRQARTVLPALLRVLGIDVVADPPWLFGHSDGGSIALIHAATGDRLPTVAGLVVLAPHVFVEDISVASIAATRETYLRTDLRERLARHHADVDSAFFGWNDIWLDPGFRDWSIVSLLGDIRVPVLAVQGHDDVYGTMAQVETIVARVPDAAMLKLDRCGHAPHRDQPEAVIRAVAAFTGRALA